MPWEEIRESFFEDLKGEYIENFLRDLPPWEVLKNLKEFLYDTVPPLPRIISIKTPLKEPLFLTEEGELYPLNVLEENEGRFFHRGKELRGAILHAGAVLMGRKIYFAKGVVVEPGAFLEEPCYFSENTQIRHASYVRGAVYTGAGAVIGHTTEVKNSLFLSGAKAAHFAYVGDSILGKNVNLGAGTKLANLKFLKKEIILEVGGQKINTGLKKLGAILGDRVQTGCNVVLQPGTLIGKDSYVYPCRAPSAGYYPPGTKIKA
ncbi:MAG: hypothetical protein N2327_00780 [Caldimicrobium sp.]|nr:hypothetical protein [Caldimicrobium sp.]MCX7872957.1 hypothetical protein [Caldimicrobium sp.]MDW8094575.1 hypothetical protein [Caldimicrobium sp.]